MLLLYATRARTVVAEPCHGEPGDQHQEREHDRVRAQHLAEHAQVHSHPNPFE